MSTGPSPHPERTPSPSWNGPPAAPHPVAGSSGGRATGTPTAKPASGIGDAGDGAGVEAGWKHALGLIEAVARENSQPRAVEALVQEIARRVSARSVRCGIGAASLRRLYDSRLGWVGESGDSFQFAASCWNEEVGSISTQIAGRHDAAASSFDPHPGLVRLNIDDEIGLGRCAVFLDAETLSDSDRYWLRSTLPALRSILWHRSGGPLAQTARFLSSSGMTTRIYIGLGALFILLLAIWPVSYRVRCGAVVRPEHSRVVSAPFDATLLATDRKSVV